MTRRDTREQGRIILAHGEVTGHQHEVVSVDTGLPPSLEAAQFFEEPDGTRVLIALEPCVLRHQEHGAIPLDPEAAAEGAQVLARGDRDSSTPIPGQYRQGDVLLHPVGPGTWHVIRQREQYQPDAWRQVAD